MCAATPLAVDALRRCCDPREIPFETTAEATKLTEIIGQDRAIEAVRFGVAMRGQGYNLFALGPYGTGKQTLLRQYLDERAAGGTQPGDWCYVQNFGDTHSPRALKVPAGTAVRLRDGLEHLVVELQASLPAAFEGEPYRTRKAQIVREYKERQEAAFQETQARAKQVDVAIVRTDMGVLLAPVRDGQVVESDRFSELPEEDRARFQASMERTREDLARTFEKVHEVEQRQREALAALDHEVAATVARREVDAVRATFVELPDVIAWLGEVETDVVENAEHFLHQHEGAEVALWQALQGPRGNGSPLRRYAVNVLVDHSATRGAPVVYEDNPTHANLIGHVDHIAAFGALVTDFTLIKAGALHRANGGYLLLDALKVLQQPLAWDALKRAIRARELRFESVGQLLGLTSTVSLEPQSIPLEGCKIILFGERTLYYLLAQLDPDFPELFKVIVDFEDATDRGGSAQATYARLVATIAQNEGLRALDRGAVARVIDHAARLAEDAEKLSVRMRPIVDLVRETDFWAGSANRAVASAADVEAAIDAKVRRAGRVRDRMLEEMRRDTLRVEVSGKQVGQVNGLSVARLGEFDFGFPTRITARVRVGKGEVLDIERAVKLGGPLHSKGVLILTGFLGGRYSRHPLSLAASLVFEQSYGQVDGDSASLAELCALLSAVAQAPIRQTFAVTGSIDQCGQVQAIGGVNEKIEGFFDVCNGKGLSGGQGVLIPKSNVKHLMLRPDVVRAVTEGRFGVFAVETVDEALELLTGRAMAELDAQIEARLGELAEEARAFMHPPGNG